MTPAWHGNAGAVEATVAVGLLVRFAVIAAAGAIPLVAGVGLRVTAAFVGVVAIAAYPAALEAARGSAIDPRAWGWIVVGEAVVGSVIGAGTAAVLAAATWAGGMLGSVAGLSWADEFTPEGDPQTAGMARLAWWLGLAGFLGAGGHLHLVAGLIDAARTLPVGACAAGRGWPALYDVAALLPGVALSLALALALPVLAAVLACHLAAAICLRAIRFEPGQGVVQAVASIVLLAAVCLGADSWTAGFARLVEGPLERCLDVEPR